MSYFSMTDDNLNKSYACITNFSSTPTSTLCSNVKFSAPAGPKPSLSNSLWCLSNLWIPAQSHRVVRVRRCPVFIPPARAKYMNMLHLTENTYAPPSPSQPLFSILSRLPPMLLSAFHSLEFIFDPPLECTHTPRKAQCILYSVFKTRQDASPVRFITHLHVPSKPQGSTSWLYTLQCVRWGFCGPPLRRTCFKNNSLFMGS